MRQLIVTIDRRLEWRETAAPKLLQPTDALVRPVAAALKSTAPYGRCTSCGTYHGNAPLPLGTMYSQGIRYTIGWANIQALMPKVLNLLAERKVPVDRIHTVARWDDAIEAMASPPVKLILAREDAYR